MHGPSQRSERRGLSSGGGRAAQHPPAVRPEEAGLRSCSTTTAARVKMGAGVRKRMSALRSTPISEAGGSARSISWSSSLSVCTRLLLREGASATCESKHGPWNRQLWPGPHGRNAAPRWITSGFTVTPTA